MLRVQTCVPKPLHGSDPNRFSGSCATLYDALIKRNPDAAPYVAVIAMNRLQRPCEALRLPLLVSRQTGDALISKTDMGLVGEILFARMDALQAAILATRHPVRRGNVLAQVREFRRNLQLHRQGNRSPPRRRMGPAPAQGPRRGSAM